MLRHQPIVETGCYCLTPCAGERYDFVAFSSKPSQLVVQFGLQRDHKVSVLHRQATRQARELYAHALDSELEKSPAEQNTFVGDARAQQPAI